MAHLLGALPTRLGMLPILQKHNTYKLCLVGKVTDQAFPRCKMQHHLVLLINYIIHHLIINEIMRGHYLLHAFLIPGMRDPYEVYITHRWLIRLSNGIKYDTSFKVE